MLKGHGVPIAPSTYYALQERPASARSRSDALPLPRLKRAFEFNYSCYRARKLWHALRSEGLQLGRDRVARLMGIAGIKGAKRSKRILTTIPAPAQREPPDLVKRQWDTGGPDRVWVADLTYVRSSEGTVYTSFIQDAGSKHILGFTVATSMATSLVTKGDFTLRSATKAPPTTRSATIATTACQGRPRENRVSTETSAIHGSADGFRSKSALRPRFRSQCSLKDKPTLEGSQKLSKVTIGRPLPHNT